MSQAPRNARKRHSFGSKIVTGLLLIFGGMVFIGVMHVLGVPLPQYVEGTIVSGTIVTGSMILQSALTASNKHVELDHSPDLKVKKVEIELEEQ